MLSDPSGVIYTREWPMYACKSEFTVSSSKDTGDHQAHSSAFSGNERQSRFLLVPQRLLLS